MEREREVFLWPRENEGHKQSKAGLLPKQFHPATVSQWTLTHALNYESNSEAMMLTHNNKYRAAVTWGKIASSTAVFYSNTSCIVGWGELEWAFVFPLRHLQKAYGFFYRLLFYLSEGLGRCTKKHDREGKSPDMRCPVRRGVIKGGYSAVFIAS